MQMGIFQKLWDTKNTKHNMQKSQLCHEAAWELWLTVLDQIHRKELQSRKWSKWVTQSEAFLEWVKLWHRHEAERSQSDHAMLGALCAALEHKAVCMTQKMNYF